MNSRDMFKWARSSRVGLLALVLLVVLAQEVVRLAFVPMWDHYDEAPHFIYVRYIVIHHALPEPTSRAGTDLLESVIATMPTRPPWDNCEEPVANPTPFTTCPEREFVQQPPGYYLLQAGIQMAVQPVTIAAQLLTGRIVSVILAVLAALAAYLMVRTVFPGDTLLAVGTVLMMGLIIGYVDLMGALSNDVGANFALTFLLLVLTIILMRGFGWAQAALLLLALVFCYETKASAWIGFPLAALALVMHYWKSIPRVARIAVVLIAVGGAAWLVDWHAAAGWVRQNMVSTTDRVKTDAPLGSHAFVVPPEQADTSIIQTLPGPEQSRLRGKRVTVGMWVRSTGGTFEIPAPGVWTGAASDTPDTMIVTPEWTFHAVQVDVPSDAETVAVRLEPADQAALQYDGVVLARGAFPVDQPPQFGSASASGGVWGGQPFTNLLRNASAERVWPLIRPLVDERLPQAGFNDQLESIFDLRRTWPAYQAALRWQFVSFWTAFSAGAPGLPVAGVVPFALFSGLAAMGLVRALIVNVRDKRLQPEQWQVIGLYAVAIAAAMTLSLLWIHPVSALGTIKYVPTARHFYVAIAPTAMLLLVGAGTWLRPGGRRYGLAALVFLMYLAGAWSLIYVQIPYYVAQ